MAQIMVGSNKFPKYGHEIEIWGRAMTYYVVRVQTPNQEAKALIFVLDRNQNLMDQVIQKIGPEFVVLGINMLGVDWGI